MSNLDKPKGRRYCTGSIFLSTGILLGSCAGESHSQTVKFPRPQAPVSEGANDQIAYTDDLAASTLTGAKRDTYAPPPPRIVEDITTSTGLFSNPAGPVLSPVAKRSVSPARVQMTVAPRYISAANEKGTAYLVLAAGTETKTYPWPLNINALTGAAASRCALVAARLVGSGKTVAVMASNPACGTLVSSPFSAYRKVTVTSLMPHAVGDALKLTRQTLGDTALGARFYRALMPELGVGAARGYLNHPSYGAGPDANGRTAVRLSSTNRVSIEPAIMAHFVCHCNGSTIAPMLQIGAATSKDLAALLLGGGLRLFGLGQRDIDIAGGFLLGWHKDLQKLKVGSAVSGPADIAADMGFVSTPATASYISLRYRF